MNETFITPSTCCGVVYCYYLQLCFPFTNISLDKTVFAGVECGRFQQLGFSLEREKSSLMAHLFYDLNL